MNANFSLGERACAWFERWRFVVLGAWLLHAVFLHWFFIGYVSWDGHAYRAPPIVELAQHGHFGMEKYEQWAFAGYIPFVEVAHLPFLKIFGLPGLLLGFPLVVFPACVVAIYFLLKELTGEGRAGLFGALTYGAVPISAIASDGA
jgi:hypothetical protein